MIKSRNDLKKYLVIEKRKYNASSLFFIKTSENNLLYLIQRRLRKTEYFLNCKKKFRFRVSMYLLNKLQNKYGIHIPLNTCDIGLKIMHIGPVLINNRAKIGKNCSVHINVSIVASGKTNDAPKIGDNVVIGIGAVILGNIKISDGIAIGANAVVNKSFEERNVTIAGIPAKIISFNGSNVWNKKEGE